MDTTKCTHTHLNTWMDECCSEWNEGMLLAKVAYLKIRIVYFLGSDPGQSFLDKFSNLPPMWLFQYI
jgi:hypothetical protein